MPKPAEAVFQEITAVTNPLEKTLEGLVNNPNATDAGKNQAKVDLAAVSHFNHNVAPTIAAQITHSHGSVARPGSGTTTSPQGQ